MIRMSMGEDHRVDVLRIDAGGLQIGELASAFRAEHFGAAVTGIEQHELVAGIDQKRVLLHLDLIGRQVIVVQQLDEIGLGHAREQAVLRRAERQRPVRNHRRLEAPSLKR